jgi:LuxR family maltose regulon positive regulatory protein
VVQLKEINEPPPTKMMAVYFEIPGVTYCRGLIASGSNVNLAIAEEKLLSYQTQNQAQFNHNQLVDIMSLLAITYWKQDKLNSAIDTLKESILLAEPGEFIFPFIEIGPAMSELTGHLPDDFKTKPFIQQILTGIELHQSNSTEKMVPEEEKKETYYLSPLTKREMDVLHCIAKGLRNQEIAEQLFNSEETIKKHIYNMFKKMDVKNRLSLVEKARGFGLLKTHD